MSRGTRTALIIGGIVVAVLVALSLVSGLVSGGQGYYGGGMMGGFGGGWGMMVIGMVVFWGLVIWGIVALAGGLGHSHNSVSHSGHDAHSDSALDVLKRRYAGGDIGKEEYEQKKKDLI